MNDNTRIETRRTFLKTSAAVGAAATGAAAFGGTAAAQDVDFNVDATVVDLSGGLLDLDVNVSNLDVDVIDDVRVIVKNVSDVVDVTVSDVTIPINDVRVANANQVVVVVQALSDGSVVGVSRDIVQL